MPPAGLIEVAAGLIFNGGKLLITQRHAHAHQGGLWEFPGGKREPGETFELCLRRELLEELGIEVNVGLLVQSITHQYPEKSVLLNFYQCSVASGSPQPLDCAALKWVTKHQLLDYQFPPADERLLERLRADEALWTSSAG